MRPLLEIENLHLSFETYAGDVRILRGVSLSVAQGEIWGIVGETGSGKSLTGRSISRLVPCPPGRYLKGEIRFDGVDLLKLPQSDMRALRGSRIGMVFQDPTSNLNPSFTVGEQIRDVALHASRHVPDLLGSDVRSLFGRRRAAKELAIEMLGKVGISEPRARFNSYPHQFSGGMRQRALIAMALIGRPQLLIADEPTTALDVSIQAQILDLLWRLVHTQGLTLVLITHNIGVVAQICSHVAVMRHGEIVEQGTVNDVLKSPAAEYTRALLNAVPRAHGVSRRARRALRNDDPDRGQSDAP
jgi:ABC-type dipeptide/oligopeptide/nickel transport system ATPase component